jgi:UDP-N-acetylglucosamine acyltransferase
LSGARIHSRAVVDPKALLHEDVEVGPGAVIEAGVEVGARSRIAANAYIYGGTTIGEECEVHPGAVIGGPPQDHHYKGERSFLKIGRRNIFRECVTVSRATGEGLATVIGDRNLLLNGAHVGHNSVIGDDCVLEGSVMVAGHVTLGDRVILAGLSGVHQFCRVGRLAMLGFAGGISQDLPPFMTAVGTRPFYVAGPNVVGLRRAKVGAAARAAIKQAHRLICRSGRPLAEVIAELERDETPEVREIAAFVRGSKRGVIRRGAPEGREAEGEAEAEY